MVNTKINTKMSPRVSVDSPVVEQTPLVWRERLLLLETWQRHWNKPPGSRQDYYLRLRDTQTDEILSRFMPGYGFASGLVWNERIYVFAPQKRVNEQHDTTSHHVYLANTADLKEWTDPVCVLRQESDENLFNQSVCYDGQRFVMAYESLSPRYTSFTIKFAVSDDLHRWTKVEGAIFGADRYTACPAIRYHEGFYYLMYLEHRKPQWWFETWLARSEDFFSWELARDNPVIAPDPTRAVHRDCHHEPEELPCSAQGREINASDPDLVEWQGRTRIYFTGGCQHWGGDLQYFEYDGPEEDFLREWFT